MAEAKQKQNKEIEAVVVSNKMKDTVTVAVDEYVKHPKYHKFIRRRKTFKAHNPGNTKQVGDAVIIRPTQPLSKTKRFEVVEEVK